METDHDKEWFIDWFKSPYYSLLYGHRDESEARQLIDRLTDFLELVPGNRVLDLACGKGRHSVELHRRGLNVTGLDLSEEHILSARQQSGPGLKFLRQDMRTFETGEKYHAIFNLFTSFGYFENEQDNLEVLSRVKSHLLPDRRFVLDYFNAEKVLHKLPVSENKVIGKVHYSTHKELVNGFITKDIHVEDEGQKYHFREKVQVFTMESLQRLMDLSGLKVVNTFGDYNLEPFFAETSERLMMIARNE